MLKYDIIIAHKTKIIMVPPVQNDHRFIQIYFICLLVLF